MGNSKELVGGKENRQEQVMSEVNRDNQKKMKKMSEIIYIRKMLLMNSPREDTPERPVSLRSVQQKLAVLQCIQKQT